MSDDNDAAAELNGNSIRPSGMDDGLAFGQISSVASFSHDSLSLYQDSSHSFLSLYSLMTENPTKFIHDVVLLFRHCENLRSQILHLEKENQILRNFHTELYIKHSQLQETLNKIGENVKKEKNDGENPCQTTRNVTHTSEQQTTIPGFTVRIEVVAVNDGRRLVELPVNQVLATSVPPIYGREKISHIYDAPPLSAISSGSSSTVCFYESNRSSRKSSHVRLVLDEDHRIPERTNSPPKRPPPPKTYKGAKPDKPYQYETNSFYHSNDRYRDLHPQSIPTTDDPHPGISRSGIVRQCPSQVVPKQSKSKKHLTLPGILSRAGITSSSKIDREELKQKKLSRKTKKAPNPPEKVNVTSKSGRSSEDEWTDDEGGSDYEY